MENELLYRYYDYLCNSENTITNLISTLIKENTNGDNSIYLAGLENSIKSQKSFENKCNRNDRTLPKIFYVYDIIRYTVILPVECFYDKYMLILKSFKNKGINFFRVKNTWIHFDRDIPYRGINVLFYYKDGIVFEVQFHTLDSYRVNMLTHNLYEDLMRCYDLKMIQDIKCKLYKYVESIKTPNEIYNIIEYKNERELLNYIIEYSKKLL